MSASKFAEVAQRRAAVAAQVQQHEAELFTIAKQLDAMGRVVVGTREHERMLKLHARRDELTRGLESLQRDADRLQQEQDARQRERDRLAADLARLEAAIASGGDLHQRIRALDAQRAELVRTLEEYKTVTIPKLRRQLAQYAEAEPV